MSWRSLGTLSVKSTPEYARVSINGERVGLTPLVLTNLRAGPRTIRVEAPGYAPWLAAVQIAADRTTTVSAVLSRNDEKSAPTVKSDR